MHQLHFNSSQDADRWEGLFRSKVIDYEKSLYNAISNGQYDSVNHGLKKTWTFFNAMFYCTTIFTTIGKSL